MRTVIVTGNHVLKHIDVSLSSLMSHHSIQFFLQAPLRALNIITFWRVIRSKKVDVHGYHVLLKPLIRKLASLICAILFNFFVGEMSLRISFIALNTSFAVLFFSALIHIFLDSISIAQSKNRTPSFSAARLAIDRRSMSSSSPMAVTHTLAVLKRCRLGVYRE